jgi:hypothetical protein
MATAPKLASVPITQSRLEPGDILTPQELAKRLKVPVSWVYKHTDNSRANRLPVLRCDGFLRFSWPDVCAWLRSNNSA